MKQTVTIENLTDLTSHWKHLPGNVVRLIDKSLSVGLYTVKATNVRVISRKTGRVVKKLRNSTPLNIKSIAALNYVIDEKAVENTLAGILYDAKKEFGCTNDENNFEFVVQYETEV